jgi:hypothetical protein
MAWLTSLPMGVLVIVSLALTLSVAFIARVAARRLVPVAEYDHVPQIAAPLMPALGAAFGILMALTLASEAGYLKAAQDVVANEAGAASRLAWAGTSSDVDSQPIHAALVDYLVATRAAEWHGDAATEGNDSVASAIAALEHAVRSEADRQDLRTPASTELLASLDSLTSLRRERIASADHQIPVLYILTLIVSGLALIINAGALTLRSSVRTSVLVIGLAAVVGLSLALLLSVSAPWRGPLVVSGHPIDAIVDDLRSGFFR